MKILPPVSISARGRAVTAGELGDRLVQRGKRLLGFIPIHECVVECSGGSRDRDGGAAERTPAILL